MKLFTKLALTALALPSALFAVGNKDQQVPGDQDRPNIIFFIADDMLPMHFNCLPEGKGKNYTPNLDRMANEGVVLMEQHVVSPVCTPSRYNCLTGKYASRASNPFFKQVTASNDNQTVVEFNTHITKKDPSLPKYLQKLGYTTSMSGKNHVVHAHGLKRPKDFDGSAKDLKNVAILKANHDHVQQAMREAGFDHVGNVYHNNPDFLGLHEVAVQNMDWITQSSVDFLKQKRDNPFFLYLATTIPHAPEEAKRSWNANPLITPLGYLDKELTVQPARNTIPKRLKANGYPVNKDTCNMLWLDDSLGALFKTLEEQGKLDNTIIFFFNDHGQNSKGTLYQGGVHNPSIVWKKGGFKVGQKLDALVSNVDFAPTIVDMAGGDAENKNFDGLSFLPYLNKEKEAPQQRVLYHELGYARAVRVGNWKYLAVRYPAKYDEMTLEERTKALEEWNAERRRKHIEIVTEDPKAPFSHLTALPGGGHAESRSTGSYPSYYDQDQLYNLELDPKEQKNLAKSPEYQAKLKEMQKVLKEITTELPGDYNL
ncbi:N-acetylgalactosamine 6-sulfatase (GALNS) [Lentisphaera araneosa HTCC2155]|uniref:N-acetylgalactosamine 6-sulfatase (GALNS) n=1 Tax=Lentisphaera araneosa HTCC2155 TaxID=313628 RepID=A6DI59_9BACT|nr:sulfatase-like hydrolase/transferase [Lentisphaera araneosa]EDM28713.1 N-acetylgalactosamine 6-sulfatase (GALNS) [Lentisphaera araneosa HTCC2155]